MNPAIQSPFLARLWAALLGLLLVAVLPAQGAAPAQAPAPAVLVLQCGQRLETVTAALLSRAVDTVRGQGIRHLVLDIRTDSADLEDLRRVQRLLGTIKADDIHTVAYIDEFALDAGAMLALSCKQIFMTPNARLGAAAGDTSNTGTQIRKILANESTRKEIPEKKELMLAAIKGTPRDTAVMQRIAQAMVDHEMRLWSVTYKMNNGLETDDVVDAAALKKLEDDPQVKFSIAPKALPVPLLFDSALATQLRVVDGQVDGLQAMVQDRLGQDPQAILILEPSWSEDAVSWINAMRPVLFVLGFILLLIEFKTPGFALPGILGASLFGLAFFGAYMVGLAEWSEILLFYLGLGLLAVEIFVMPGTIFFGVAGFLCIVSGLILSQQVFVVPSSAAETDLMVGHMINFGLVMVAVMAGTWAVYANIHRIPLLKKAVQAPPASVTDAGSRVSEHEQQLSGLLGQAGVLASDLRPAGWMDVGAERIDVVSEGAFLPRGAAVRVVAVQGNRVVVAPVEDAGEPNPESGEVGFGLLILLVLVGLAFTVGEVFLISGGIMGIIAGASVVTAVFLAYTSYGSLVGTAFLIGSGLGVVAAIRFSFKVLPKTALGKQLYSEGPDPALVHGAAQEAGLDDLVGKAGVTTCDLRPAGYARIEGRRVDVVTRGELIEEGRPVEVIKIDINQVIVRETAAS